MLRVSYKFIPYALHVKLAVSSLYTFKTIRLVSLHWNIVLRQYSFTRRRQLNDLSETALVAGLMIISLKTVHTSYNRDLLAGDKEVK